MPARPSRRLIRLILTHLILMVLMVLMGGSLGGCTAGFGKQDPPSPPTASGPRPVVVEVLYSGTDCGFSRQAIVQWLEEPGGLDIGPSTKTGAPVPRHAWDPRVSAGLWIQMGTQPTGGYGLHLPCRNGRLQDGELTVAVQVRQPEPGDFVSQAITNPCLLLRIPKAEVERIHIVDQFGRTLHRIKPRSGTTRKQP